MTMRVVDAATGSLLTTDFGMSGAMATFTSFGHFVVPASGRLVIRILGWGSYGETIGTAPYAFFVRRGP